MDLDPFPFTHRAASKNHCLQTQHHKMSAAAHFGRFQQLEGDMIQYLIQYEISLLTVNPFSLPRKLPCLVVGLPAWPPQITKNSQIPKKLVWVCMYIFNSFNGRLQQRATKSPCFNQFKKTFARLQPLKAYEKAATCRNLYKWIYPAKRLVTKRTKWHWCGYFCDTISLKNCLAPSGPGLHESDSLFQTIVTQTASDHSTWGSQCRWFQDSEH